MVRWYVRVNAQFRQRSVTSSVPECDVVARTIVLDVVSSVRRLHDLHTE